MSGAAPERRPSNSPARSRRAAAFSAIDISEPLLARARDRARERAGRATVLAISFVRADAQVHRFAAAGADLVVSRFGVMFFADPVAAFRQPAGRAAAGRARLLPRLGGAFDENPWFSVPLAAAVDRLGRPEPTPADAPGPLAFADRARVTEILREAGYADIAVEAEPVNLGYRGRFEDLVDLAANVGPATRVMQARDGGPEDAAAHSPRGRRGAEAIPRRGRRAGAGGLQHRLGTVPTGLAPSAAGAWAGFHWAATSSI